MLRQLAEQKDLPGYRITLDMPCFLAVITYADNRDLRQRHIRSLRDARVGPRYYR